MVKEWWKYSKLRFYTLNAMWNYKFWIFCEKQYEDVTYFKKDFFRNNKSKTKKRRFKGYLYKGIIHLDNPGIPNIGEDVWKVWKTKGIIK